MGSLWNDRNLFLMFWRRGRLRSRCQALNHPSDEALFQVKPKTTFPVSSHSGRDWGSLPRVFEIPFIGAQPQLNTLKRPLSNITIFGVRISPVNLHDTLTFRPQWVGLRDTRYWICLWGHILHLPNLFFFNHIQASILTNLSFCNLLTIFKVSKGFSFKSTCSFFPCLF